MEHDDFYNGMVNIHVTSIEEADAIWDYYDTSGLIPRERNTVNKHNWMDFPYFFAVNGHGSPPGRLGIHGYGFNHGNVISFKEWEASILYELPDIEFDLTAMFS